MKLFYIITIILFSNFTYAENLLCTPSGDAQASTMKIVYNHNIPNSIYLKNISDNEFVRQDVNIQTVFERNENNFESFSVKPNFDSSQIDWNKEPNCFKLVGTQWYFNFYYDESNFSVFLNPFYVRSNERCVPPRNTPVLKVLDCI